MAISPDEVRTTMARYLGHYPAEKDRLSQLIGALDNGSALTSRKEFLGHVTCGAVILDPGWRVLHIRHNALVRWLMPGGHLESEDLSLSGAALREVCEETAITSDNVRPLSGFESMPIDIDIHPIPANPDKDEAEHWHFDFRYAFRIVGSLMIQLQDEEVSSFEWLTPNAIPAAELRRKLLDIAAAW